MVYSKENWRKRWDSNPRWASTHAQLATECFRPLSHASVVAYLAGQWDRGKRGKSCGLRKVEAPTSGHSLVNAEAGWGKRGRLTGPPTAGVCPLRHPRPKATPVRPRCLDKQSGLPRGTSGLAGPAHGPRAWAATCSFAFNPPFVRPISHPRSAWPRFLTAKLEAARCIFTWVASIITISVCCDCADNSVMIVATTPIRLHRRHRL